jgi:arylsulfatase A-like enzyme
MVSELSGLDQGFDVYNDFLTEKETTRPNYQRAASRTVSEAITWLAKTDDRPFFLFLHLIDPHGPYNPPAEYKFHSDGEKRLGIRDIPPDQYLGSVNAYEYLDKYDGEIAYTDSAIGSLMGFLKREKLFDDSFILIAADHGESLGEHNYWFEHGEYLYDACTKIPLIVKLPEHMMTTVSTERVSEQVSLLDILPTITDVTGIPYEGQLDGESLVPLISKGERKSRSVFLERKGNKNTLWGIREGGWKLILTEDNESSRFVKKELYHLTANPQETNNVYGKAGTTRPLEAKLRRFIERAKKHKLKFAVKKYSVPLERREGWLKAVKKLDRRALSDEDVGKLKALGYVKEK